MFFVKLVGLFDNPDSFKKSDNASFDTLSKKIQSCSFAILLCFTNEIAKYEDDIIIYVLYDYNMDKYFTEYPKNQFYTCFDGNDKFVNLKFKHNDNEYLFVEFISGINNNKNLDNAL